MTDIKKIITEMPSGLPLGTVVIIDAVTNEIIEITKPTS